MSDWGLLPGDIYKLLKDKEWVNIRNLQKRMTGERAFPVSVLLKPPTDRQAVNHISKFQHFISDWKQFQFQEFVCWETRQYRSMGKQDVPVRLVIEDMQSLIKYIGKEAVSRSRLWEERMTPLLAMNQKFFPVLTKHLCTLEAMPQSTVELLVDLLPQMRKGMGVDLYARALPLVGVDTKFVEMQAPLISDLLDVTQEQNVSESGGLYPWLGCKQNPSGWLTVRPLCKAAQEKVGGFPIFQLTHVEIVNRELPATNILVVENLQSGLGLPQLDDTIAVCGVGRNVGWMRADWLKVKNIGYWGDIDTWGFAILNDARVNCPNLVSIMMNVDTALKFKSRMVEELEKCSVDLPCLKKDEYKLFNQLKNGEIGMGRLEQERIPPDYSASHLEDWLR